MQTGPLPGPARLRLRITAAAETAVRSGHPWVFSDSVLEANRAGQAGEFAVIYDRKNKFLAVGLFDPDSPIRVRILHAGKPQTIDAPWWQARLEQALARRRPCFADEPESSLAERGRPDRSNLDTSEVQDYHAASSSKVAAPGDGRAPAQTTGYRLIHGESDGWPGLVLDRYDMTLVLKLYTSAWLPRLDEVLALLKAKIPCERMVLRLSRNIQHGALDAPSRSDNAKKRDSILHEFQRQSQLDEAPHPGSLPIAPRTSRRGEREMLPALGQNEAVSVQGFNTQDFSGKSLPEEEGRGEGKRDGQVVFGPTPNEPVIFLESGIRFEADVIRGQKTGFFLDQRENRREVETLARGRRVLNAFSFSGGFSVYAARGGAAGVTDLDRSPHALESARRNFALNLNFPAVAACRHETVQADAFEWIEKSSAKFDLIVLDPPSLAKRATEREGARRAYERLNSQGIRLLARDGILVAGSCSAHVSAAEFFDAVRRSALKSGRKFSELKTLLHPPDHPAGFKEAEYLKVIYLRFAT